MFRKCENLFDIHLTKGWILAKLIVTFGTYSFMQNARIRPLYKQAKTNL